MDKVDGGLDWTVWVETSGGRVPDGIGWSFGPLVDGGQRKVGNTDTSDHAVRIIEANFDPHSITINFSSQGEKK